MSWDTAAASPQLKCSLMVVTLFASWISATGVREITFLWVGGGEVREEKMMISKVVFCKTSSLWSMCLWYFWVGTSNKMLNYNKVVGDRVRNEMPALCFIKQVQCHTYTGYCWCVTPDGKPISGSSVQNKTPVCSGTVGVASANTNFITREGWGQYILLREPNLFRWLGQFTSLNIAL